MAFYCVPVIVEDSLHSNDAFTALTVHALPFHGVRTEVTTC